MKKRFLRLIAGLFFLSTILITIIPFLIIWAITGRNFISGIMGWICLGEYDED